MMGNENSILDEIIDQDTARFYGTLVVSSLRKTVFCLRPTFGDLYQESFVAVVDNVDYKLDVNTVVKNVHRKAIGRWKVRLIFLDTCFEHSSQL